MDIAPEDTTSSFHRGQRIDRYELLAPLARGAASAVWIARMRSAHGFEKLVALKALGGAIARDAAFRTLFLEEARLASAITHPHVAHVLDLGARDDLLYIVTEYVDGDSLFDLCDDVDQKRMRLPPAIALRVLSDACAGLHAAHLLRDRTGKLLNVVHGDVSSRSILISANGVTKVIGFGVAKARARAGAGVNATLFRTTGELPIPPVGQKLDRHSDIWAVGATLHQIAGHVPVIEELVERALSSDPAERFATAAEMQRAIEATLASMEATTTATVAAFVAEYLGPRAASRALAIEAASADTEKLDSLGPIASTIAAPLPQVAPDPRPTALAPVRLDAERPRRMLAMAFAGAALLGIAVVASLNKKPPQSNPIAIPAQQPSRVTAPPPCPRTMVLIPASHFYMGSDDDLDLEKPAHHVSLHAYCIDPYEITVDEYKACSDAGDCKRAGSENKWEGLTKEDSKTYDVLCNVREPMARGKHPINCVDWQMAKGYCEAHGDRLPTEAEWELAARGPDGRKYPWGDEEPSERDLNACGSECVAWGAKNHVELEAMYDGDDGWATTAPVGSYPAGKSRYGLYDVVGNVWEWTADSFAPYGNEAQDDPRGAPSGEERVIRGGAWNGAQSAWVRPTFRYKNAPDTRSYGIGFRCARDAR